VPIQPYSLTPLTCPRIISHLRCGHRQVLGTQRAQQPTVAMARFAGRGATPEASANVGNTEDGGRDYEHETELPEHSAALADGSTVRTRFVVLLLFFNAPKGGATRTGDGFQLGRNGSPLGLTP